MMRFIRQLAIIISLTLAVAYLVYRGLFTLNFDTPFAGVFAIALYAAEIYGCTLMALYLLQVWDTTSPESRPPLPGRTVDVLIPTYNEDVQLLRGTVAAAKQMDYPHKTYILDDGNRPAVKALAEELGVEYITRTDNIHAKAGNLNHALDQTDGEFVIILDADHVAAGHFITRLIGHFEDDRLAFVQTPHAFYNFDNFQGSVDYQKRSYWEEGQLFYNVVQPGKTFHNAVVFCGSAAMFRRSALEEVGLIATETITEDMHTGLRLHAHGWKSLFVNERLIAGQAAPDVTTFHSQRLRWGEGNLSILAYDNPLWMKGLTLTQRLNYLGSILSWTTGVAKVILYFTPIVMLLSGVSPVMHFTWEFLALTLGYLGCTWTTIKLTGNGHGDLWQIERAAMANYWTQVRSTFRALFRRGSQRFVVTNKRGRQSRGILRFVAPQIVVLASGLVALGWAGTRYMSGISNDWPQLMIGAGLVIFHSALAWSVIRQAFRTRDLRFSWRHPVDTVHVRYAATNKALALVGQGASIDVNERGLGFIGYQQIAPGTELDLTLQAGWLEIPVRGIVRNVQELCHGRLARDGVARAYRYGVQFENLTGPQTDALWNLAIQYAAQRQYDRFESVEPKLARGFRPDRLPVTLLEQRLTGQAAMHGAVTEAVSPNEVTVLLERRYAPGDEFELNLDSPFGQVVADVRVSSCELVSLSNRTLYRLALGVRRFNEQSRSVLNSLWASGRSGAIGKAIRPQPHPAPWPVLQPLAAVGAPAMILMLMAAFTFHAYFADQLLLARVAGGKPASAAEEQRIENLVDKALTQPNRFSNQVGQLRAALAAMNRYEDSDRLASLALAQSPNDYHSQLGVAENLSREKKYAEADIAYRKLLNQAEAGQLDAESQRLAWGSAARNAVHRGDLPTAIQRFEQLLALEPNNVPLREEVAGVLLSARRPQEAQTLLSGHSLSLNGRFLQISIYTELKEFAEADRLAGELLKVAPNSLKARELWADIASWQQHYSQAVKRYQQVLRQDPDSLSVRTKLANNLLWDKQYATALEAFTALLEEDRDNPALWLNFIYAADGVKKLTPEQQRLLDYHVEQLGKQPHPELDMLSRTAEVLIKHSQPRQAIALLERSLAQDPSSTATKLRLADLLHNLGEFKRAEQYYQELLKQSARPNREIARQAHSKPLGSLLASPTSYSPK